MVALAVGLKRKYAPAAAALLSLRRGSCAFIAAGLRHGMKARVGIFWNLLRYRAFTESYCLQIE